MNDDVHDACDENAENKERLWWEFFTKAQLRCWDIIYKRLKHLCLIRMRSARAPRGFIYSVSEKSVPLKASSGRQREGFVCGVHHWWAATPCYSSLYISSLYLYFCVFLCLYLCICIDVFVPMARHPLLLLFKHLRLHNVDSTTSQYLKKYTNLFSHWCFLKIFLQT